MLSGNEIKDIGSNIIYEKIRMDQILPVNIILLNLNKNDPTVNSPKHWHRSLEMILPKTGEFDLFVNGTKRLVKKNGLCIINSREIHSTQLLQSEDIYIGYVIQINNDYLTQIFPNMTKVYFDDNFEKNTEIKLVQLCDEFIEEYINKGNILILDGLIRQIVGNLVKHQSRNLHQLQEDQSTEKLEIVSEVMNYIDSHYNENINVTHIASHFNFSYGYLARVFKNAANISLKQYVKKKRIEKCVQDLLYTNLSMTEIAYKNGFPSPKAFSTEFKETYQITPKQFRNDEVRK